MSTRNQRWQHYRASLPLTSRFILSFTIDRLYKLRNDYAARYIRGEGYEIGAQNSPLQCKNASNVIYIDYLTKKESAKKYNIKEEECVEVDIVADANNLETLRSESASFIVANHVIEHSPNPIGALIEWLRVLKPNGILFLTVPNYNSNEFDFEKKPASLSHFIEDNERDKHQEDIVSEHILEHVHIIDGLDPDNKKIFEKRYQEIVKSNLHTHYHVFNRTNCLELLHYVSNISPFQVINSLTFEHGIELLFILEKSSTNDTNNFMLKKESLFNYSTLLKHVTAFLFNRYFV